MPTTLNIVLDDADADRAREVKDALGLTWEGFIKEAADALDARHESTTVAQDVASYGTDAPGDVDPEEIEVPGSGDKERARQETVLRLYAFLMEEGTAAKGDFLEVIDPDDVGYASAESFWSNVEKNDKYQPLRKLPGVKPPAEGEHNWRYVKPK